MRKILILLIPAVLLSCGTDYFYSSFYYRELDFNWMLSPSDQNNLNYKITPIGVGNFKFNSPSVLGTPDNYILFFYERREDNNNSDIIGVNGVNDTDIYVAISKNAQTFSVTSQLVGGSSSIYSHGSPISFVNKKSEVVVLASSGIGFGGAGTTPSLISKSVNDTNGAYRYWSDWEDLPTSVFEPLIKDYDRFYTSPDSGITLRNGTLACIIDYKKHDSDKADGFAILYSTDDGVTWKIGAKTTYSGHRFAKIIAEKNNGSLLIAATANSTDYKSRGNLAWFELNSLNGTIQSISPTGLPEHNCGSTAGGKIKLGVNGFSRDAIVLLHSYPEHGTTNQNEEVNTVINSTALYISFDEGNKWEMVTNVFYPLTEVTGPSGKTVFLYDAYDDMSSFRQSMRILKDGTVACVSENGGHRIETSGTYEGFKLVYRRFSLNAVSSGRYKYEGI